jgi:uncharacterized protein (DUF2062 family)
MDIDAPPPSKPSIWHRVRTGIHTLVVSDVRPARLGAAVGLGVAFGCTPFFGFQFVLALLIAVPLRLNKLAVAIGTQISTPPLTPFVIFAGANLGELMLHRRLLPLTLNAIRAMPARQLAGQFLLAWTVGGLTLGVIFGVIAAVAVAAGVRIYRSRRGAVAQV